MIGHILLTVLAVIGYILLALLALIVILLLIPAGARVAYEGGKISLLVCYGPVKLQILPKRESAGEKKKESKKRNEPSEEDKDASGEEKEKKKFSVNLDQILYSLEKLPPILGRALKGVGRSIRLNPLKVHILVAGVDPADTALLYGKLEGALTVGVPALERLARVKHQDVRLFVDFREERPDVIADVGIFARPGALVLVALRAGVGALRWFLGFRKLAGPTNNDKRVKDDTKEKEAA